MTVFLEHVQIHFASCHFSLLVIMFHSVSSCPYRKDGLLLIQIRNSQRVLYLMNQLAHNHGKAFNFKEFTQHQVESCAILSCTKIFSLSTSLLRRLQPAVSDMVFKESHKPNPFCFSGTTDRISHLSTSLVSRPFINLKNGLATYMYPSSNC